VSSTPILYPVGDRLGRTAFHTRSVPGRRQFWCKSLPHQFCTRSGTVLGVQLSRPIVYPAGDTFAWSASPPILYLVGHRFGGSEFHTNSVAGR